MNSNWIRPKISKRPISISSVEVILSATGRPEKFDIEPISPKPGPTLLMHDIEAVKPVRISQPKSV